MREAGRVIDVLGMVCIGGVLLWLVLSAAQPGGLQTPVVAHGSLEGKALVVGDYVPLGVILAGLLVIYGLRSILFRLVALGLLVALVAWVVGLGGNLGVL